MIKDNEEPQNEEISEYWEIIRKSPSSILVFATFSIFFFSYLFNVGYFYFLNARFISLLSLRDYFEGTLPIIGFWGVINIVNIALHSNNEDVYSYFKRTRKDAEELKEECYKHGKFVGCILYFFLAVLFASLALIQLIGINVAHSLTAMFLYLFFIKSMKSTITSVEHATFLCLILLIISIGSDLFISSRPKQYKIRKALMKLFVVVSVFSFSYGLYKSSFDISSNHDNVKIIYFDGKEESGLLLRAVSKGIFHFNRETEQVLFSNLNNVKTIEGLEK